MKYIFKGSCHCNEGLCPSNSLRFIAYSIQNIRYRKGAFWIAPNLIFRMAYCGARDAPQQSPIPQISDDIYSDIILSVKSKFL